MKTRQTYFPGLLLIFLLAVSPVFASELFHRITEDDGLSSRTCFSVRQDKYGFMWISTKLGIDRYDGKNIRHYHLDISQSPGYDNIGVNYLRNAPDSALWAFNEAGIVYCYDENKDTFEPIYEVRHFFNSFSIILYDLVFDEPGIILLTTSKGVLRMNSETKKVERWAGTEELAVNHINKVNGTYLLSTHTGLYTATHNAEDSMTVNLHSLPGINTMLTYADPDHNRLLIGTLNSGIYSIPLNLAGEPRKLNIPISKPIRSIISYGQNQIAVGVDLEGVFILDKETLTIKTNLLANEALASAIVSNNVRGLFVDNQGSLWVATYHGGVSYEDSSRLNFRAFVHHVGNPQSMGDNDANAVMEDSQGHFWFGTNNGVSCFDRQANQWKHYFNKTSPQEKGEVILALCEDALGNIWCGGYSFGVACINIRNGSIQRYRAGEPTSIISTNYIYSIYRDGNLIWFGGIMGNITSYDVITGQVKRYNVGKVNSFARVDNRHMLVGLFNGLFLLDKETGEATSTGITNTITSIYRVDDGHYLIGTHNHGFYYYNHIDNTRKRYNTKDGLSSNYIYCIAPDYKDNLWIGTENGLNRMTPNGDVTVFEKHDGLPSNQFSNSSCYVCRDKSILMGTVDGAVYFHPDEIVESEDSIQYSTFIYQFDLFSDPVYYTGKKSPLDASILNARQIELAHNRNFFSFHFATPNVQTPRKTLYSYYLDGHDIDWSIPSVIDQATYSRVPPGRYTFRVRAVVDGITQNERNILVHISEPWWNTMGARLAYLVLLMLAILYIYKVIKRRQEKKSTETKIDFFVTTAHDLLTPLNLIQAPLKDLETEISPSGPGSQLLAMALNNSAKLAHYVEKLLDFQRVSLNASRLVVSPGVLESFLRHRTDSFKLVAGNKFITIESQFDANTSQKVWFDKEKITRILDNLLSNAIKYTPYGGKITIEASVDQHRWYLRVKDTGIGISPREQRMIFKHVFRADNAINSEEIGSGIGLKLVGSLVKLHKGKISFRSKVGEGTEFLLSFPLDYENMADFVSDDVNDMKEHTGQDAVLSASRILVVEDDPEMSRYIEMSLNDIYQVSTCSNGIEALDTVNSFLPHLIISDVLMPGMTGFELCTKIKDNVKTSHIPVLLLTGVTDKKSVLEGIRLGAIDYINKPFDKEVLRNKIANIFELQRAAQRQCIEELKNNNAVELSNRTDNEFMDKLRKLIDGNIDNPELNISFMCSELALSRTLLYNKITQLTGKSPTEFIRIFRLKRAASMLISGEYSVTDVSFKVGIDNPKYFSRIFKEFYGVSPKEYLGRKG